MQRASARLRIDTGDDARPASLMDALARARRIRERGDALVAGCLSGTSADGIDVGLMRLGFATEGAERGRIASLELVAFATEPYPAELGARVRAVLEAPRRAERASDGAQLSLATFAELDRDLGRAFGSAVRRTAERAGVTVDLVGSHGQTLWHHDGARDDRATLQLGGGAYVAAEARAATVSDFRHADCAAGGEGAPLSALVEGDLFPALERPAVVLNLGGIGNLTYLPERGGGVRELAFDTGPAGCLLDGLARRHLERPFDEGGERAARGEAVPSVVEGELARAFYALAPPKSTGRDAFGEAWLDRFDGALDVARPAPSAEDRLATGVDLVAASVALAVERFLPERPRRVVVAGGGARNLALMRALASRTGLPVESSALHGVDPDAREALVFGLLAVRFVLGIPSTAPWATGARAGSVLGALHLAPVLAPALEPDRGQEAEDER